MRNSSPAGPTQGAEKPLAAWHIVRLASPEPRFIIPCSPSTRGQRKGARVIQYRRFRNTDPPALAELWNDAFQGRGAFPVRSANLFEYGIFAKPYFDPNGLLLAEEDGQIVGFVHAGFGPNPAETGRSTDIGIICAIAVRSS